MVKEKCIFYSVSIYSNNMYVLYAQQNVIKYLII